MNRPTLTSPDWQALRQQGDPLADAAIAEYFAADPNAPWRMAWDSIRQNGDASPEEAPEAFRAFLDQATAWPAWGNHDLFAAGQRLFGRYAQEILSVLGLYSLPYCYAAADGAKVLYASEQIRKNPGRRLADTGDFVLAVMHPQALDSHRDGRRAVQKVRLLHASIRYHLQRHAWDTAALGVPINQADMSGTNLAFGWLVLVGLKKLGFRIAPEDQTAFLHTWKVLGYWMGVQEAQLTDDPQAAKHWEATLAAATFRPSKEGQSLTRSLLQYMRSNSPVPGFGQVAEVLMGGFMGTEVATILGLTYTRLPSGSLPLFYTPLRVFNGRRRDARFGYHQASLMLKDQRKRMQLTPNSTQHRHAPAQGIANTQ